MLASRLAALALLGLFAMSTSSAALADDHPVSGPTTRTLTDFTEATPDLGWYVVNDGVMGGKSRGGYQRDGDAIHFTGSTNTDGGGFSSIRTERLDLDLDDFDGIRVRVKADGRRYTWRLTTDARWRGRQVSYWADFATTKGEWTTVDIPFSRFLPQWRGRMLAGLELDPASIRGMGLMIYDKQDGPFELHLEHVQAYRKATPALLADVRGKSRLLVVSAPSARDEHVRAQLTDIARSREQFADRDLVLVMLLDDEARMGERVLSREEAAVVRSALEIDEGAFALRLVGKDGGVKRSADEALPMTDLYALIDTMPMRRQEMQR